MPKYYGKRRTYKRRYYRKKRYGVRPYRKSYRRSYRYRTKYIGRRFTRPTARKLGALYKRMGMRSKYTPSRYTAVKRYKRRTGSTYVRKAKAALKNIGIPAPVAAQAVKIHMNRRRPGPVQLAGAQFYGGPPSNWDAEIGQFQPSLISGARVANRAADIADESAAMADLIDSTLSNLDRSVFLGPQSMDDDI